MRQTILKAGDDRSWMELNAFVGLSVTSRLGVSLRYTFENSNVDGQKAWHRFVNNNSLDRPGEFAR